MGLDGPEDHPRGPPAPDSNRTQLTLPCAR